MEELVILFLLLLGAWAHCPWQSLLAWKLWSEDHQVLGCGTDWEVGLALWLEAYEDKGSLCTVCGRL